MIASKSAKRKQKAHKKNGLAVKSESIPARIDGLCAAAVPAPKAKKVKKAAK